MSLVADITSSFTLEFITVEPVLTFDLLVVPIGEGSLRTTGFPPGFSGGGPFSGVGSR